MSSNLRALQSGHEAWRSFRDIAHATRALAAARRARWAAHAKQAGDHLAWVAALSQLVPDLTGEGRPRVVVGIGTDLGLCGRLNQLVHVEVVRRRATSPALTVVIGERLGLLVDDTARVVFEAAPVSPAAVLELAERLELALAELDLNDAELEIVVATSEEGGLPHVVTERGVPADLDNAVASIAKQLRRERRVLSDLNEGRLGVLALVRHARLAYAICRAQVVESSVRWAVMHRAHEGAERRIGEQELELRRLRQEEITQEMLDVVAKRGL